MVALTPLAVRMGRAFSLGSDTLPYSSGIALIMATSLGTPTPEFFPHLRADFVQGHWLSAL